MRTKTLLLTAALTAAGALTSMAQVYSVNIVGYINLSIPVGYRIIANQLNNTPDNTIATLFPAPPDGTTIYKFHPESGGYDIDDYIDGFGWDHGGSIVMNPGEGAFIHAPTAFTATFVGEVQLVSNTGLPPSTGVSHGFTIMASPIPQTGAIDTDLKYAPVDSDSVYQFNGAGYHIYSYIDGVGWDDGSGNFVSPVLSVGEGVFVKNATTSASRTWHRCFNVDGTDCP